MGDSRVVRDENWGLETRGWGAVHRLNKRHILTLQARSNQPIPDLSNADKTF